MKAMKKTRWGAIALVIALVFASGLTLTGCDNGPGSGPGRGFDPVGTWVAQGSGAHGTWNFELILHANGMLTGIWSETGWDGSRYVNTMTGTYFVSDMQITLNGIWAFPMTGVIIDNNTFVITVDWQFTFIRRG